MKRSFLFILVCMLAGYQSAQASEVLDRILATVNNTPILLSDWDEAWRCEALLAGRAPESYNAAEQKEVFEHLVDQELLREQMRTFLIPTVTREDVQKQLDAVRTQLSGTDPAKWKALLDQAGITEDELARRLRHESEVERFLDVRFRAGIQIDFRTLSQYYRDELLPKLRKAGAQEVPLEKVAGKIREVLIQRRMSELSSNWIQTLREQADIEIPPDVSGHESDIGAIQSK